ncbi:MAG: iron-sulfur cluster assembly protein [Rhodobiaceae bacterium]|jgi:FeS assembly SUF system protein
MNDQDYNPYLPGGPGSRLADGPGLADFLPDTSSGFRATAGTSLAGATGPADAACVEAALKSVHDPEIPVNIFDLGLIYDVDRRQDGDVYITMSLTAPGCPVAGEMPGQVAEAVAAADGVGAVTVELVWEPAWSPERMSEDAKLALDLGF